ncbi:MAG: alpha/beta hydrolase [Terriglobales bacterium]
MRLERITNLTASDGHNLPGLLVAPDGATSAVVLLPPYGAGKEVMLGLALAIGERGVASISIDNCGHGENHFPIGASAYVDETESAIAYARNFYKRVAAGGISLGGRLSLMSSADCMVAISPAVVAEISPQGKWMFENFPSPSVREPYSGYVNELLKELGPVKRHDRPCLLLYSERDIPMILNGAKELHELLPGSEVRHITREIRPDVQHESGIIRYLPRWFNHMELKFNLECMEVTAKWLASQQATARSA